MIYVLYGPDSFSIGETVAGLKERLIADDPSGGLNLSELAGAKLTVGELEAAASTLPFLGDRRLVIVHRLLERCNTRGGEADRSALGTALCRYLPGVPATTRLVFVDGELDGHNPVLKWARSAASAGAGTDEAVIVKEFAAPDPARLPGWLEARASGRGGQLAPGTARALSDALVRDGTVNLRAADSELEKLLTYAGSSAATPQDVRTVITSVSIESIFKFVDALGDRNGAHATSLLQTFLDDGEHPLRILTLVARQVRQLTLAKTLAERGTDPGVMRQKLGVPPFIVTKLVRQSKRYTTEFLVSALKRLAQMDADIKTGRISAVLALDLFVAGMCGTQARPHA